MNEITNTAEQTEQTLRAGNRASNKLYLELTTPDRSKTQTAYAANYFPRKELNDAAARLVVWSHRVMLYKGQILAALNEDMTQLSYSPMKPKALKVSGSQMYMQQWAIHWRYNAIPTQLEWERKSTSYVIEVEFRVIADGTKIVLLSF